MSHTTQCLLLCTITALTLSTACSDVDVDTPADVPKTQAIELNMRAMFGDAAFACGTTYDDIGRGDQRYTPSDARMYVHDIELLQGDKAVPLVLTNDGAFQTDDVVLLDFEDGTGACSNGTPQTNTSIKGVAAAGDFDGIRFKIGVPASLNHANQAQAASPLNISGLWWSWQNGYKHMRFDGTTEALPEGVLFHLGSTMCTGEEGQAVCANANLPSVTIKGWEGQDILLDVKELFKSAHFDADEGGAPGCMSGPTDPDCAPIFDALGLSFGGSQATETSVFILADN